MAEKYDPKVAAEFVMRMFHARTAAHVLHLKAQGPGAYAEHKALNEFYDEIVDLADGIAEMLQGEYLELLTLSGISGYQTPASGLALVTGLSKWISANRKDVCPSSECQNLIDGVLELCHSTAYKLKFLK